MRARAKLGWSLRVDFETLVDRMVDADLEAAVREARAAGLAPLAGGRVA